MSQIRHGDYLLEVLHLSESNYYHLVNAAGLERVTLLELQIYDDGYCVDFLAMRRELEKELRRLQNTGGGPCGIA